MTDTMNTARTTNTAAELHVTFFRGKSAMTLWTKDMTLEALRGLIQTTDASEKDALPWLKLATFGDKKSDKWSLRHDANVNSISGVEGDYDRKLMSFETAYERLKRAGLSSLLYASPSCTRAEPKWRVLCPTSRNLPPEQRAQLLARINGVLGGVLSAESFTLSQSYYYGSVNNNPEHRIEVIVDGDYIDLRPDLDAGALGKSGKPLSNGNSAADEWHDEQIEDDVHIENIRSGREYHTALVAMAARQIGRGMDADSTVESLRDLMNQSNGPRDKRWHDRYKSIPKDVASAVKKFGTVSAEPSQTAGEPSDKAAGTSDQSKTDAGAADTKPKEAGVGLGVWDAGDDVGLPPPRGWLLGNTFCRKFLSSLLGDGGVVRDRSAIERIASA
jgi:hypothetical protein